MKKIALAIISVLILGTIYVKAQTLGGITVPQGGTGLTSVPSGYVLVGSTTLHLGAVSTTSVSCSGSASCSSFTVLGSTPITISASGSGGGSGTVSTSTNEVAGRIPYWTSNSGTPALLGQVATGTVSAGTGISVTAAQSIIGSGLTITNTAPNQTVTLNSGTGISVSGSYPTFTITNTGSSGSAYPFTPTTNFGVPVSETTTPIWDTTGLYASSTSYLATTTVFTQGDDGFTVLSTDTGGHLMNLENTGAKPSHTSYTNLNTGFATTNGTDVGIDTTGNINITNHLAAGTFRLLLNGTNEVMDALPTGQVGIGTTSPYAALSVVGSSGVVADNYNATDTNATSTFLGNVLIGNSYRGGILPIQGVLNSQAPMAIEYNVNDLVGPIIVNTNTGAYAASALTFLNGGTTGSGFYATNYAALGFSGPNFSAFPGLQANGFAILVTDGGLSVATESSNYASSTQCFAIGPGYAINNCDVVFDDMNPVAYPQNAYLGNVGIGTTSPFGRLVIVASSTTAIPYFLVASSTNNVTNQSGPQPEFNIFEIASSGSAGFGTTTPVGAVDVNGSLYSESASSTLFTYDFCSMNNMTYFQATSTNSVPRFNNANMCLGKGITFVIRSPSSGVVGSTTLTAGTNSGPVVWAGQVYPGNSVANNTTDTFVCISMATSTTYIGCEGGGTW